MVLPRSFGGLFCFKKIVKKFCRVWTPFAIDFLSSGRYDFTIPLGMADGAQPGDTLEIYHHAPEIDGRETKLLTSVQVKEVVKENDQIWVEMSKDEVETFLSEFGFGISCVLVGRGTGEL